MALLLLFTLITKGKMSHCKSTELNPNYDQFQVGCDDDEACCRNTQQTLMELDGFTSGFQSFNHAVPTIFQLSSTHWRT